MTDLKQMIADQARLKDERMFAWLAYDAAKKAYEEGSRKLTDALAAAAGWHPGKVISLKNGEQAKIARIRLTDTGTLQADCHDRTLSGAWSARPRIIIHAIVEETP